MEENEIWKDITGFEGMYQVSNLGRVKSLRREIICNKGKRIVEERILKQTINNSGYFNLQLTKESKYYQKTVHRLVLEAFVDNPENKEQINHINAIKNDNRLINLEWSTRKENMKHACNLKLLNVPKPNKIGSTNNGNRTKIIYNPTGEIFDSIKIAAQSKNVSYNSLRQVLQGKMKRKLSLDFSYI
jgi:hypothetical protein